MQDYIKQARQTEAKISQEVLERMVICSRAIHATMGLTTEVGELTDMFKKCIFYNKPLDYINIEEEVGDILWYIAILFDQYGYNFETCMAKNIAKLRARFPNKFTEYDAKNRDLNKERGILETGRPLNKCCELDTDGDGNCHIHSAPGVLRKPQP